MIMFLLRGSSSVYVFIMAFEALANGLILKTSEMGYHARFFLA